MARKTVLVCDNCGNEVGEGKGAVLADDLRRCPPRREAGRSLRRLRGEDARARRSRAAAASRSRPPPADEKARSFRTAPHRPGGAVGGRDYDGPMGLALVVGPANAGKVALLLDRYLDALDRDPVLIVPNRSDVDRVERDLLRRRPALLTGSIGTFDDLFERLAYEDGEGRPLLGPARRGAARPSRGRRGVAERPRPLRALRRLRGRAGGRSRRGRLRAARAGGARGRPRAARGRLSRRARPVSASGIAASCAGARSSAWPVTSTHGGASPCSPTGSRT